MCGNIHTSTQCFRTQYVPVAVKGLRREVPVIIFRIGVSKDFAYVAIKFS